MPKSIKLREYTSMMIAARRVSRSTPLEAENVVMIDRALLVQLLETLDDLTGIDTSVPNKVTMRMPR